MKQAQGKDFDIRAFAHMAIGYANVSPARFIHLVDELTVKHK